MSQTVAYFSMEVAIDPALPTYSGGLGVLAGDTIRAAADLGIPMVAVTLLHRKGYVHQTLTPEGIQREASEHWEPEQFLTRCKPIIEVPLKDRVVCVQAWQRHEVGVTGHTVPVLFLDTDISANIDADRAITDQLYGGDAELRIIQELVLGVGGSRMLRALGYPPTVVHHMNEGHAAFLLLELVPPDWMLDGQGTVAEVRNRTVFTTHTPVAAGHDIFHEELVAATLSSEHTAKVQPLIESQVLNMTKLALRFSGTVNAVSRKHQDVTTQMFPQAQVLGITNGVHAVRWVAKPFAQLYDRYLPGWRQRSEQLRQALLIPTEEVQQAHRECREELLRVIDSRFGMPFGGSGVMIGFARRATEYKRPLLIFSDPERLCCLAEQFGPLNFLFAGKAHPRDEHGKHLIQQVHEVSRRLGDRVRVAFLPNYEVQLAAALVAGVDLWLNTPRAPLEASGTSGMKCALNGVPSLSIADGWWLEGGVQGVTGWVIRSGLNDGGCDSQQQDRADAEELYHQLEHHVLPCFFSHPGAFAEIQRNAIALNGSFFNTHRMVEQYRVMAYEKSHE